MKERNISIPGDIGIIGFANEIFSEHISPPLSTINQQTVKMGEEAFHLLLRLMNGLQPDCSRAAITLEALPVYRESSLKNGWLPSG